MSGMRISELAHHAGVSIKAVRYYETLGLITPRRRANGYREYDADDVRLVREIRVLSGLGIPAKRTRPFLDCLAAGRRHADDCPESLAGYRKAIDELTERIGALTGRRSALESRLREAACRDRSARTPDEREPLMSDSSQLPANLPVPEDDGQADHLPGLRVPHVELADTGGARVCLDALGTGRTVLYAYPLTGRPEVDVPQGWDSIPGARGCTAEACDFRDHYTDLVAVGARRIFGLSSQGTDYQRELVERLRLPFAMLSDPDLSLVAALGLPTFHVDGLTLFKRLTLIIRDNVIEHVFYPIFPPQEHGRQVLSWLHNNPA